MEPGYASRKKCERIARQEQGGALEELETTGMLQVVGEENTGQVEGTDVEQEDEDCLMFT